MGSRVECQIKREASNSLIWNALQLSPTDERSSASLHGLFSSINRISLIFRNRRQLSPILKIVKVTGRHRFTRLNLNRSNSFAIHKQTINLFTMIVLLKIWQAILAKMEAALNKLIEDQILEKPAF
jgi:hypothetical protein